MSTCIIISKYLLCVFNALFWLAGGAWMGLGIYIKVHQNASNIATVSGINFYYAGIYILLIVGSAMLLLGVLGWYGTIAENRCVLGFYIAFLLALISIHLGVGIWSFAHGASIERDIVNNLNNSIPISNAFRSGNINDSFVQAVIGIQGAFQCCGILGGCRDWQRGISIGCECGNNITQNCGPQTNCMGLNEQRNLYRRSCYNYIRSSVLYNLFIVADVGIAIGSLEICGMILAIIVCRNDKTHKYQRY